MVNLECKYIIVCLTYLGNSVRRFFLALLPVTALMPRLAAAGLGKIRLPVKNIPAKFAGK